MFSYKYFSFINGPIFLTIVLQIKAEYILIPAKMGPG